MPTLSHDEIKAAIADGKVFAITIDTAVFDAKQKTFQNGVLQRLDQFHPRDLLVIITDVVANEIKAHLRDEAMDTQRALKKALRLHNLRWRRTEAEGEGDALMLQSDATALAPPEQCPTSWIADFAFAPYPAVLGAQALLSLTIRSGF